MNRLCQRGLLFRFHNCFSLKSQASLFRCYLLPQPQIEYQTKCKGFTGCGAAGSEWNADYGGGAAEHSQEEVDEADMRSQIERVGNKWGESVFHGEEDAHNQFDHDD